MTLGIYFEDQKDSYTFRILAFTCNNSLSILMWLAYHDEFEIQQFIKIPTKFWIYKYIH